MSEKHKHQGKLFNIRIDLKVSGSEIVVNREKTEDIHVAIRDAFDAARRKLEAHVQRIRGEVQQHEVECLGRVARIFSDQGYGFVEKSDGTELYFHVYKYIRISRSCKSATKWSSWTKQAATGRKPTA